MMHFTFPLGLNAQNSSISLSSPKPTKQILSLITLFVIKSLDDLFEDSIKMSRDAVKHIALLIYQKISELMLHTKDLTTIQGKRMTNVLQLFIQMFQVSHKRLDLNQFFEFLNKKKEKEKKTEKFDLEHFIKKKYSDKFQGEQKGREPEKIYKNLSQLPPNDYFARCNEIIPLYLKSLDLFIVDGAAIITKKPETYTYKQKLEIVHAQKTKQQLFRHQRSSQKDLFKANQSLKKFKLPSKGIGQKKNKRDTLDKFDLHQFI